MNIINIIVNVIVILISSLLIFPTKAQKADGKGIAIVMVVISIVLIIITMIMITFIMILITITMIILISRWQ